MDIGGPSSSSSSSSSSGGGALVAVKRESDSDGSGSGDDESVSGAEEPEGGGSSSSSALAVVKSESDSDSDSYVDERDYRYTTDEDSNAGDLADEEDVDSLTGRPRSPRGFCAILGCGGREHSTGADRCEKHRKRKLTNRE